MGNDSKMRPESQVMGYTGADIGGRTQHLVLTKNALCQMSYVGKQECLLRM